jgi:hypothetical protein
MFERISVLFIALPGLMRLGVLILAIGGMLDLLYHAAPPGWAVQMDGYLGTDGIGAHVVTLIGMVITLLGVFAHRPRARDTHGEIAASERGSTIEQ